jgi:hypothetical protein
MSFFQKKMSQNDWATILPFGPVTIIFYWPQKKFRASQRLALISGTDYIKNYEAILLSKYDSSGEKKILNYASVLKNGVGQHNIIF